MTRTRARLLTAGWVSLFWATVAIAALGHAAIGAAGVAAWTAATVAFLFLFRG